MKIIKSNYAYTDFLKLLKNTKEGKGAFILFDKLKQGNNFRRWGIHHISDDIHYIQNRHSRYYYDTILQILTDIESVQITPQFQKQFGLTSKYELKEDLQKQLKQIILIPIWLHDSIHWQKKNISTRSDYIRLLKEIMSQKDENKQLKNKKVRFNGSDLFSALQSIERLITTFNIINNKQIEQIVKKELKEVYDIIIKRIERKLKELSFD